MNKVISENPDIKKTLIQIKEYLNGNELMEASFFGTNLVCAKTLGEFILEKHELRDIPRDVQYILAQTWNQYATIFCPGRTLGKPIDLKFQDYFESGSLDDRFAYVVKQLYEICKEENLL